MKKETTRKSCAHKTRGICDSCHVRAGRRPWDGRRAALLIAERIKMFREDCNRDAYTDTGDAWTLLDEAEKMLREVA